VYWIRLVQDRDQSRTESLRSLKGGEFLD